MKVIEVTVKDCDPNGRKPGLDIYFPKTVVMSLGWGPNEPVEVVLDDGAPWQGTVGLRPPNPPYLHRPLKRASERLSARDWLLDQGVRHGARIEFAIENRNRVRWVRVLDAGALPPGRGPGDRRPIMDVEKRPRRGRSSSELVSAISAREPLTKDAVARLATQYWGLITAAERGAEVSFERRLPEHRRRGFLDKQIFLDLACWKSRRPKPLYERNSAEEIEHATADAFRAIKDADAIHALTALHGVGLRTATALLHWMRPTWFPILDIRAINALGKQPPGTWEDVEYYLEVAQEIRDLGRALGVDLRTIDRALWARDKLQARLVRSSA